MGKKRRYKNHVIGYSKVEKLESEERECHKLLDSYGVIKCWPNTDSPMGLWQRIIKLNNMRREEMSKIDRGYKDLLEQLLNLDYNLK